jgi:type II secretory pathway component GspD/PulD (secretin)
MDVPQQTPLYDPYEENLKLMQAGLPPITTGIPAPPGLRLASGQAPQAGELPSTLLAQAKTKVNPPIVSKTPGGLDLIVPRGPVFVSPLNEFGAVVITANNQADLELALKIIKQLEDHLKQSASNGPAMKIVELEFGDAVEIAAMVNRLGAQAQYGQQAQFANVQNQSLSGSVLAIPLPKLNSIMLFGPELRFPYYENLIKQFDVRNTNVPYEIQLKKGSAQQIANQLNTFYATRYPGQGDNLVRITYSTPANAIYVQGSPADVEEIKVLIEMFEKPSPALNQLRIYHLRNTLSTDMAAMLEQALFQNILPQGTGIVQPATGTGAAGALGPGGALGFGGALGGGGAFGAGGALGGNNLSQASVTAASQAIIGSQVTNTTKTVALRFLVPGKDGTYESGYLEDVHITPHISSNSLLISAPEQTLKLLEAVIQNLDVPSATVAQVNVFTLKKADAVLTSNMLIQLFTGAGRTTTGGAAGGLTGATGTTGATSGVRPLLTSSGQIGEGAGLIDLRITVDDRTNSIIVAGTQNDLDAIRAIIYRLENATYSQRTIQVYRLKNAAAADVYSALSTFLTNSLTVYTTGVTASNYLEMQRNITIYPEPVSNNLIIDATPEALAMLIPVIQKLDATPLQVMVETLIAEVLLDSSEEFGVELGLQSPVLFQRSVIPSNSVSYASATGGTSVAPGVSLTSPQNLYPGQAFAFNSTAAPAYNNFQNVGQVAMQGITNYGVGRANANGIGGFVFSAGSDSVNVLIRALKTQGRIDNLNRPTLTILDNQVGSTTIGGLYPYTSGGTFSTFGTFTPTISQQTIGTSLTVTPRISDDGRVLMRVEPSITQPQTTLVSLGNGQFATAFDQQAITTTVTVMDGETIVLGGLVSKTNNRQENKVPWLGDLPYIGTAFRYRTQTQEKRELLVILTPHVIRNCADSERLLMEEARKMSWVLKDVDRLYGTGPGPAYEGGHTVVPRNAWVQPDGGPATPLPIPNLAMPEMVAPPIPPATTGIDPMPSPMPAKPNIPTLPGSPSVPQPPKPAPGGVVPSDYKPAQGIVAPGVPNL